MIQKNWWKILGVALLVYTIIAGLLGAVPRLAIINETIRGLYFHVPMWFAMVVFLIGSLVYSIRYLRKGNIQDDHKAVELAKTGLLFGMLGIITGILWANYAWGTPWHGDPKQNGAAIALLIYFAYLVLRGSIENEDQKARISSVYNIFAFAAMIPLLFILPRLTSSMHPGSGGNPGFNMYDTDNRMLMVFYPAIIGWILLGFWITQLRIKIKNIKNSLES